MKSIKIVKAPKGSFGPPTILEQWIGVEIRLPTELELRRDPPPRSWSMENLFFVRKEIAIEALKQAQRHAAVHYWNSFKGRYLVFPKDVCEVVG